MEGTRWTGERKWSYSNRSAESMSSESGRSREWRRKWECTESGSAPKDGAGSDRQRVAQAAEEDRASEMEASLRELRQHGSHRCQRHQASIGVGRNRHYQRIHIDLLIRHAGLARLFK